MDKIREEEKNHIQHEAFYIFFYLPLPFVMFNNILLTLFYNYAFKKYRTGKTDKKISQEKNLDYRKNNNNK
uniref:Uncharacterized protein n=1 Tax=Chlorobium phaeobacteroides (strain BS1) TaxID=331678 RepID=B3EJH6_CHLPB